MDSLAERPSRAAPRGTDAPDAPRDRVAARGDAPRLIAVVVEAPPLPPSLASLERWPDAGAPSLVWSPRGGPSAPCGGHPRNAPASRAEAAPSDPDEWSFVGWGAAARAEAWGPDRFAEARARAAEIFDRLDAAALPIPPRLFGGFAFDDAHGACARCVHTGAPSQRVHIGALAEGVHTGAPSQCVHTASPLAAAWSPFAAASFTLPRALHASRAGRAFLAAFVPEADAAPTLAALDRLRRALESRIPSMEGDPRAPSAAPPRPAPAAFTDHDPAARERAYRDLVARGLAEIEREAFAKVVLCRTRHLSSDRDLDPLRALAFLDERHPTCARFLFRRAGSTFLGASPERLVALRGLDAVTEALAGSMPRLAEPAAAGALAAERAALLASAKDRAEHAFVVAAIRAALEPCAARLDLPREPDVRSLAHLHHLATPITATLRAPSHVLDLAARLHPTPALCGAPRAPARAFILAAEPEPRGWYGGGVGWLDATGDGAIAVAIRSALLAAPAPAPASPSSSPPGPRDAFLYAGAGIVRGSEPAHELAETITKERAVRDALEAAS